uniref:TRP C-terminal domain-containing protein n=1 Tax=Amphimedon queenslandica TaxID=400682 RepID=A0A1X7UVE7_AMPQE
MSPGVVLVSLLSLVLVYSAAGLECRIYVSSSHGINNTSCWTGGVQTPCATIDLAIQGTATLQYNCSSGILINLSPGTYTLDTTSLLEQQLLRNNVSIIGMRDGSRYEELDQKCYTISKPNCEYPGDDRFYQVKNCFNDYINAGPIEVSIYIQTLGPININISRTVNVTVQCESGNRNCDQITGNSTCDIGSPSYKLPCIKDIFSDCCTDNTTGEYYTGCASDWGIPMNDPDICIECDEYDFTPFAYNYVMCISPNTPPLGVISFWYVIGFYPLLLLLLLYVWITLYDKGYKCVVFITRPLHRCMARFWSMTGIEPSFTHSIASIYILCFTQLAATSFKILSVAPKNETLGFNNTKFYYDMKQDYFKGVHGAAGFFAILVLLFLIVLPTLYILLYPFKWFHKLLDCLRLKKPQLLISLGDVFTGPYKNGTENTHDYRFMAGLYLLTRIIILGQFIYGYYSIILIPVFQACCSFLLAVTVIIFRPFQENIHNFAECLILFVTTVFVCTSIIESFRILSSVYSDVGDIIDTIIAYMLPTVNGLVFGIIIPGYIIYQVYKMIKSCHRYHKKNNPVADRNQEEGYQLLVGNDNDRIADRMENPQEYDEQHVSGRMYDVCGEHQQPIAAPATYGIYSAAGLECKIYVSSSDGINNTSCWTGGVQTPCATIDLAIQGTATLQYNCSSGILINLSPGTYTLDTTSLLEAQLLRNNVSIIGMRDGSRYEEVSITCLHVSSSSYNWSSINSSIDPECYNISQPNCYPYDRCYNVDKCFNNYIGAGPIEVSIYVQTLHLININTSTTVNVTTECSSDYYGNDCKGNRYCYDNVTKQHFLDCTLKGVPLNPDINFICIECDEYGLLDYFKGVHGAAGFFAILVLLFLIVLPTLYLLLYPFKWFHKLLDCLHLRKQLLISLGDVFTGPYKNGTENTYDYRFMAGLYLLARIIILSQFIYAKYYILSLPISQACCSFLLSVTVIIFRPFQRNIHNFVEFLILFVTMALGYLNLINFGFIR